MTVYPRAWGTGAADDVLAVARLDHHAVWLSTHDRLESPVLDFEDDDAQVGTDYREIRVTIADPEAPKLRDENPPAVCLPPMPRASSVGRAS